MKNIVEAISLMLIVIGVGLIYLPAGIITLGLLMFAGVQTVSVNEDSE